MIRHLLRIKKESLFRCVFLITLTLSCLITNAQNDTTVFRNDDSIVGEIKSLSKGVLKVKTDYSDSDFKIEWLEVKAIYSQSRFLITLDDGRIYSGIINTVSGDTVEISRNYIGPMRVHIHEIVELDSFDGGFLSRFTTSIDVSYSFTKANNFRQIGLQSFLDYKGRKWNADLTYKMVLSQQESVENIKRVDGNVMVRRLLPLSWYISGNYSALSNTEQALDLRSNFRSGLGRSIFRNNTAHLGFEAGTAYVNELFSDGSPEKNSLEAYVGAEYFVYGFGDLSIQTRGVVFPGITEKGRVRIDYMLDLKYDFPLDLYVKSGLTLNYDNQSVVENSKTDYVILAGFGWEFN